MFTHFAPLDERQRQQNRDYALHTPARLCTDPPADYTAVALVDIPIPLWGRVKVGQRISMRVTDKGHYAVLYSGQYAARVVNYYGVKVAFTELVERLPAVDKGE